MTQKVALSLNAVAQATLKLPAKLKTRGALVDETGAPITEALELQFQPPELASLAGERPRPSMEDLSSAWFPEATRCRCFAQAGR